MHIRGSQIDRTQLLEGDLAPEKRTWTEFESALLGWESKILDYERRTRVELHLGEADKVRLK